MPERAVRLFPEAEAELKTSERWYAQRSPTAAAAFLAEFDDALARIAEAPETWPRYRRGTRHFVLRRFPFSVVYRIEDDVVYVVAVAHEPPQPVGVRGERLRQDLEHDLALERWGDEIDPIRGRIPEPEGHGELTGGLPVQAFRDA